MGYFVIVLYQPKKDQDNRLLEILSQHFPALESEDLVTHRAPIYMKAKSGGILEIFEWKSRDSIQAANKSVKIQELWGSLAEVAEFASLDSLQESHETFANFEAVNFKQSRGGPVSGV